MDLEVFVVYQVIGIISNVLRVISKKERRDGGILVYISGLFPNSS